MSRNRTFVSTRTGLIDEFDPTGEADSSVPVGPADGCTRRPDCTCVDCARVPASGHFAFENEPVDYGMEDW